MGMFLTVLNLLKFSWQLMSMAMMLLWPNVKLLHYGSVGELVPQLLLRT